MAYLTAAEARERRMALLSGVADAEIDRLVSEFEAQAERFVGVPMVPRASVVRVAVPSPVVSLAVDGPVRSVTSVAVDGVAVSGTHKFSGSVVYPSVAVGPGVVTVSVQVGLDAPPEEVLHACAEYVGRVVAASGSGTSRDVLAQSFDGGTTRYSTPDWSAGRPTGFLEVDRLLVGVRARYWLPGVA